MHPFIRQSLAVFRKDLLLEIKDKYALNTVLVFVIASLLVVLFSLKAQQLEPESQAGLIWIIILFAAIASLARTFVLEADKQTFDLLRLHSRASSVFTGKLIYNFLFVLLVNAASFLLYIFFLGLPVYHLEPLVVSIILGSSGLTGISTMLSAIVSKADRKGAVFSVLSIPLLVPLILLVSSTTEAALVSRELAILDDTMALVGYSGVTISAGILLFDFIWEE